MRGECTPPGSLAGVSAGRGCGRSQPACRAGRGRIESHRHMAAVVHRAIEARRQIRGAFYSDCIQSIQTRWRRLPASMALLEGRCRGESLRFRQRQGCHSEA